VGVEVWLHTFLNSVPDGGEWSGSRTGKRHLAHDINTHLFNIVNFYLKHFSIWKVFQEIQQSIIPDCVPCICGSAYFDLVDSRVVAFHEFFDGFEKRQQCNETHFETIQFVTSLTAMTQRMYEYISTM